MKLIIDVEPRYCKNLHSDIKGLYYEAINRIIEAVSNGIPYEDKSQGDLISRSYLKQMIPAPIEDEYKYVHQIIDNAPSVDAYPFEQLQELVKLNQQFAQEIENLEKPQPEWVTDELCRLRSCLRSGTHVGSYLQTQAQIDRFIKALDDVIKPN